jgi:hypothetical protein
MTTNQTAMPELRKLTDRYKRVPLAEITTPPDGTVMVYKDHWWAMTENDEVLFYEGKFAQCNIDRRVVEHVMPEGCKAVLVPIAFKRINISDYA